MCRFKKVNNRYFNSCAERASAIMFAMLVALILLLAFVLILTKHKTISLWLNDQPAKVAEQQLPERLPQVKKIIFITIDTLRADHLNSFGYLRKTSPFIDELALKGIRFTNAYSAASHTAPSHTSMFTSLYPMQHAVRANGAKLSESIYNLPLHAKQAGFTVAGLSAVRFMEGNVGFDIPSGLSKDLLKLEAPRGMRFFYRSASQMADQAIAWLKANSDKEKIFLWLHFYDVHTWDKLGHLPEKYIAEMQFNTNQKFLEYLQHEQKIPLSFFPNENKMLRRINNYDAQIRYVDDQIRRVYSYMQEHDLNKQALWTILADHGEGLGNHNYEGHGKYLYKEQLHIPLIFYFSDQVFPESQVNQLVRTIDLFPTLAELMGYPLNLSKVTIQGASVAGLIPLNNKVPLPLIQYSFAERRPKDLSSVREGWEDIDVYALQDSEAKFIYKSNGKHEVYDLKKDPFELTNLYGSNTALSSKLQKEIDRLLSLKQPLDKENVTPMTPETLEELRALGYL